MLNIFSGIICGGLRTVREAGFLVVCYTSVEIDEFSRAIARKTLSDLQEEYHGNCRTERSVAILNVCLMAFNWSMNLI